MLIAFSSAGDSGPQEGLRFCPCASPDGQHLHLVGLLVGQGHSFHPTALGLPVEGATGFLETHQPDFIPPAHGV